AMRQPLRHHVLYHLLLPVDGEVLVDQLLEIDAVDIAIDIYIDARMIDALAFHPLAGADLRDEIGGPVLDKAGAQPALDVGTVTIFDDDRLDPPQFQEPRQHQSGRPRSNDADLCAHAMLLRNR